MRPLSLSPADARTTIGAARRSAVAELAELQEEYRTWLEACPRACRSARPNPVNARRFQYCVCVQNRNNGHWGGADQEHHHAFFVGRISAVVPSPERPDRYLVEFSEYAVIDWPNAWPGLRNPVRYGTLEEFGVIAAL